MDGLVRKAYENWDQVIEYDSKSLMNFNQVNKVDALDYAMPVSVPSQPSTSYSGEGRDPLATHLCFLIKGSLAQLKRTMTIVSDQIRIIFLLVSNQTNSVIHLFFFQHQCTARVRVQASRLSLS